MDQIERIEKRGGHGHGAIDALAAFLPTLKGEDRRLEIHPIGRECQGLRGATARIQQGPTIGPDLTGGGFGGGAERGTLGAGERQAVALRVIDLHPGGGGHRRPFARRKRRLRKISIYFGKMAPVAAEHAAPPGCHKAHTKMPRGHETARETPAWIPHSCSSHFLSHTYFWLDFLPPFYRIYRCFP